MPLSISRPRSWCRSRFAIRSDTTAGLTQHDLGHQQPASERTGGSLASQTSNPCASDLLQAGTKVADNPRKLAVHPADRRSPRFDHSQSMNDLAAGARRATNSRWTLPLHPRAAHLVVVECSLSCLISALGNGPAASANWNVRGSQRCGSWVAHA
jgi:hypothetical protein